MNTLFSNAILKADEVRMSLNLDMYQPVNIFDICNELKLTVRFIDVNMEGMYVNHHTKPAVLISSNRPLPRRVFTCAHELGHHIFGHGSTVDALVEGDEKAETRYEELLVDAFAGALLMPVVGVQAEFAKRGLRPNTASAIDYYTISSVFGTGYQTLLVHCRANGIIEINKEHDLKRYSPSRIFKHLVGPDLPSSHFKIIDAHFDAAVVDLEVSNYIILPQNFKAIGDLLTFCKSTSIGDCFRATKSGIVQVVNPNENAGFFVRVQKSNYVGLSEFRHLESETE